MPGSDHDKAPTEYRGGAVEPDDAKNGAGKLANEGVAPPGTDRDQSSVATAEPDDMALKDAALGGFVEPGQESDVRVPRDGGDNADATTNGGPDDPGGPDGAEGSQKDGVAAQIRNAQQ